MVRMNAKSGLEGCSVAQVVKKMGAKLQVRVVPPPLVEHWRQRIWSLGRDIARINEASHTSLLTSWIVLHVREAFT